MRRRALLPSLVLPALIAGALPARAIAATTPDLLLDEEARAQSPGFPDPLEGMNRLTFRLNLQLDRWVLGPLARGYAFVVPGPARRALRRALVNLNSPAVFANDVLQLKPLDAGATATRFALNTTAGLVGLFDPASELGIAGHHADFGQTLALTGVPSGPFLILPVAGPTTARDGVGYLVDLFFRPITYILTPGATIVVDSITEGSAGIVARDTHGEALRALEASSVDYYAALRNAVYQERTAAIAARRERPGPIALARRALLGLAPAPPRREIGDLPAQVADQRLEALTVEH